MNTKDITEFLCKMTVTSTPLILILSIILTISGMIIWADHKYIPKKKDKILAFIGSILSIFGMLGFVVVICNVLAFWVMIIKG